MVFFQIVKIIDTVKIGALQFFMNLCNFEFATEKNFKACFKHKAILTLQNISFRSFLPSLKMIGTKSVNDSKPKVRSNKFSLQGFLSDLVYMCSRNPDINAFHKTHKYMR